MRLKELARIVGGCLVGENREFNRIITDSRRVNIGDVFVAIKGERFDGHMFVKDAIERGAVCSIVERKAEGNHIIVGNTINALLRWSHHLRKNFKGTVVAVLGAVGKTTTKSMLYQVLKNYFNTSVSPKSYNNFVGLFLSVNSAKGNEDIWILELGTNKVGEIEKLSRVALPNHVIFTRLGPEHLEGLKTTFNAVKEEYAVLKYSDGIVLVHSEAPFFPEKKHYRYGFGEGDFVGKNLRISENGVRYMFEGVEFFIPYPHLGFAENSLGVAAFCKLINIPLNEVADILSEFKGEPMRMEILSCNGVKIINDTYNSNPISVDLLLRSIYRIYRDARVLFVFGDMLELGGESEYWHRWAGERMDRFGISGVVGFGELSRYVVEEAGKKGLVSFHASTYDEIVNFINREKWDMIVVKGSRGMKMEKVVQMLCSNGT